MRKITFLVAVTCIFLVGFATKSFALATEPTTQATAAGVYSATSSSQLALWTIGTGTKHLLLYSTSSDVATAHPPVDGTTYTVGSTTYPGYIVGFSGIGSSALITGLSTGTTYYYAVFTYEDNGTAGQENYKTTSAATANGSITYNRTTSTVVTGTWETASTWSINAVPLATDESTVTAAVSTQSEPVTITSTASASINPAGLIMENGAYLALKPNNAATYNVGSATNLEYMKNVVVSGNNGVINVSANTSNSYGTNGYTIAYRPAFTNVQTINYNLGVAGSVSTACKISFAPTAIPTGVQLNVTATNANSMFALYNATCLQYAKVNLGENVRLMNWYNVSANSTTTIKIGELSGNAASKIEGCFASDGTRILAYEFGGLNTDATFNGIIKDYVSSGTYPPLKIYKKGTGTWTLTGASTYSASNSLFNVDAGEVIMTGSIASSNVPVTVASGAKLTGTGNTPGGATTNFGGAATVNGTLTGSMKFGTSLTLGSSSTTNLTVNGYTGTTFDVITVGTTVTNGGTLNIKIKAIPSGDTSIKLINASTYTGSFSNVSIKDDSNNTPVGFSYNPTTGYLTYSLAPPTTQTSNLSISNVLQNSVNLSWTNGNGSKNLVLYSTNSDVSTAHTPQDNATYSEGGIIYSGYTIGTITGSNSATISGLSPNTQYYFAVFSFNDYNTTGIEKYLIDTPANGTATTPPNSLNTDYFRTKTSGRWDAKSSWESSSDGSTWHIASMLPQNNSTSVLVTATASPITIGASILPTALNTESGASLKISKVFENADFTFAPAITGSGSLTIQLDTVPNSKPYIYTINPGISGISTLNYVLNPLLDVTGLRVVGGGSSFNAGFGGTTSAPSNMQLNVTTTKTINQTFALADDSYLKDSKLNLGDYVNLARLYSQGAGSNIKIYIGELSSNASTSHPPILIGGIASATDRTESYYIGSLNTDATYGGQFAMYSSSGYSPIDIHKEGTGIWTLTGTANTSHSGGFYIDNGKVILNGSIGTASLSTIVANGATLDGTGTVNGSTTINGTLTGALSFSSNVTVGSTGKISIESGKTMTIPTLTLNSDANGTATLVNTGTVSITNPATVKQFVTESRNWYFTPGISDASSDAILTSISGSKLYSYNETNNNWDEITTPTSLVAGKGYLAQIPAGFNNTINFTGALNNGDKTINVYRNGTTAYAGYNLIGNPYPSYLNWNSVTKTNVSGTMWYRTKESGGYKFYTYNGSSAGYGGGEVGVPANVSNLIPPMQAFWVRVNEGETSGSVAFTNAMRAHRDQSNNLFKLPSAANKTLRLVVSNGSSTDETLLYFNDNAENTLDNFDSPKMFNNSASSPEIYTTASSEKLVINGMKTIPLNTEIPLGFNTGSTNSFSISLTELKNMDENTKVFLKDKQLNTETEITDGQPYMFSSLPVSGNSRFSIIFRANSVSTATANPITKNNTMAYVNNKNHIVFVVNGELNEIGNIRIFTSNGQKIIDQQITSTCTEISELQNSGAYIIQATVNGKISSSKLIVK